MNKVKFLGIGARGKVIGFTNAYNYGFLYKHGLRHYVIDMPFLNDHLITIQTKNGETIVHLSDVITYVGNEIWSVSRDEIQH